MVGLVGLSALGLGSRPVHAEGCVAAGFDAPLFAAGTFTAEASVDGDDEDEDDDVEGLKGAGFRLAGALDCDQEHDVYLTFGFVNQYKPDLDSEGYFELGSVIRLGGLYETKIADMGPVPLMVRVRAGLHSLNPKDDFDDLLDYLDEDDGRRWGMYAGGGAGVQYYFDQDQKIGIGADLGLSWHHWWLVDYDEEVDDVDYEFRMKGGFLETTLGIEGRLRF